MVDLKAFFAMSYGLYLISCTEGDKHYGCVVNTLQQITAEPPRLAVTLHKENATTGAIQRTGHFAASVLSEEAPMQLVGRFGFWSSNDRDKFDGIAYEQDDSGHAYVTEKVIARYSVKVEQTVDVGTHLMFIGEATEAELLDDGAPLTYAYYHQVKGGKTPPRASSYNAGL